MLRRLREEPLTRLASIDCTCRDILRNELCEHLAQSDGAEDADFPTTVREIHDLCDKGSQFLRKTFPRERPAPEDGAAMDAVNKDVHDFKNLVAGISYRCQFLHGLDDSRFLPFAEDIEEIQRQFAACMAVLDEARGITPRLRSAPAAPAAAIPENQGVQPLAAKPEFSPATAFLPGRILVVDDESDGREFLVRELERQGHTAVPVDNGRQALEILEHGQYTRGDSQVDLVLLDVWMPEKNGFQVLEEMKKDYGLRAIPVVMLSANDDIDCVAQCISAGADDYLTKPFEPRLLQARVNSCLIKRKLSKQERMLREQVLLAKQRSDNLLYQIFPYTVAEELITSGAVKPRGCDRVAVMFCDIVGFTSYCDQRPPDEVVARLDELFTGYEQAVRKYRVEKIKTVGDCMMITAGVLQRFTNPVLACLRCGMEMIEAARNCSAHWDVRVGIHSGPVVAGMAGNQHYAFDVWGDTVNTASRIEGTADPGTISVSEPAWADVYQCCKGKSLGSKLLKGKQSMEVFRFEAFREPQEGACAE
jgi:class 3 adenylate cyclase